ncbi:MAG: methyltransferase [Steroidobacteraceae bacterium]
MSRSSTAAPESAILDLVVGFWSACAVATVARLGIADRLAHGPRSAEDLAGDLGADADALFRLLRATASLGVFSRDTEGRFALTPIGERLRSDVPGSQRALIASELDTAHYLPWGRLEESVRSGGPVFEKVFSMKAWEYYRDRNPEEGRLFSANMTAMSQIETQGILAAYSFADAHRIVDVGGAHGAFLAAALRQAPSAHGILFDQAQVIAGAGEVLERFGVTARVQCVAGDFFGELPRDGDVYLLKHILHDWSDADCVRILRRVREAMAPQGRLVAAELPLPEVGNAEPIGVMLDLNMLLMLGGRERTAADYASLFGKADLRLERVVPTTAPIAVIEARPR